MTDAPRAPSGRPARAPVGVIRGDRQPLRVGLVNDYPVVVAGLATLLTPFASRVRIVELAAARPISHHVDVLLFDAFGCPESLTRYVEQPGAPVLVLSFDNDPGVVADVLRLGAAGYVFKGVSAAALVDALERAAAGHRVIELGGDADLEAEVANMVAPWPGRTAGLGHREAEILALICQGLGNQEIAEVLYLSINTVKTYIRSGYRKIGVTSRSRAVLWGVQHGLTRSSVRLPPDS